MSARPQDNTRTGSPEGLDVPAGLAAKRQHELKSFLTAMGSPVLRKQVADDDQVFTMVMQLAIDDYGVGQKELAQLLQTNSSTVGRWKQAQAFPSPYSRPGIMSAISTLLSNHISQRENAAERGSQPTASIYF